MYTFAHNYGKGFFAFQWFFSNSRRLLRKSWEFEPAELLVNFGAKTWRANLSHLFTVFDQRKRNRAITISGAKVFQTEAYQVKPGKRQKFLQIFGTTKLVSY
jgi:hypothetical protein